jgi:hypothetical protein
MTTRRRALRALVGKKARIERDGVSHVGVLAGEAYRRAGGRALSLRWILITGDGAEKGEVHFAADTRWIVEPVDKQSRPRIKGRLARGSSAAGHPDTG